MVFSQYFHFYTTQSYASHKADVQALCLSPDETMVFSSGVHSLIAKFELVDRDRSGINKMWVPSRSKVGGNDHTHDVKALVVAGDFLVSGGKRKQTVYLRSLEVQNNPNLGVKNQPGTHGS